MSEFVKFYKGQSTSLPATVQQGALYHCLDTKDTWLATNDKYAGLTLFSCAKFDSLTDVTIPASDLNNIPNDYVTIATNQTITGLKTFAAPSDVKYAELNSMIIRTANGGSIRFAKEGPTEGTMIRLDQADGTARLRVRATSDPGTIVWEQPEANAVLHLHLGASSGSGVNQIVVPNIASGTLVLGGAGAALGKSTKPVYIAANGQATECSTYAGGTKVTLNGSSKGGTTASFYAPTSAGTSNYILQSAGSGAPTWTNTPTLSRLVLTSTNDVVEGSYNSPALTVGPSTGSHIEIDDNEIQAKTNDKTVGTLYLGGAGGSVNVNGCSLDVGTSLSVGTSASVGTSLTIGTTAVAAQGFSVSQSDGTAGYGISLYGSASPQTYGIYFGKTATFGTHGGVTSDWATYFGMNSGATTRGWIFRREDGCVASISGAGTITGSGLVSSGGLTVASTATFNGQINMNNGMQWKAPGNISCVADGGNAECSFDLASGVQWHVWSTPQSRSILCCYANDSRVEVPQGLLDVGRCRLQYNSTNQCLHFTFI